MGTCATTFTVQPHELTHAVDHNSRFNRRRRCLCRLLMI
jgi:hypothetical protein